MNEYEARSMRLTMRDLIQVPLQDLPPAFSTPGVWSGILEMARALPPICRGGFECRLSAGDSPVDLSQSIAISKEELAALESHIAGDALIAQNHVWGRIRDLCTHWLASPPHSIGLQGIWLEMDADAADSRPISPSIFLKLHQEKDRHSDRAISSAKTSLEILQGRGEPSSWQRSLNLCFDFDSSLGKAAHIGLMMARGIDDTLKLVFRPASRDCILPFLKQTGWSGPEEEIEALIAELCSIAGRIDMVQVDANPKGFSKVGLELAFEPHLENDQHYTGLLDYMAERGLCSPEKRDGLLAWAGCTEPSTCRVSWPESLIIESLLGPLDRFSLIERHVSHIKIIYQPGRPLEAKGYLWFQHIWYQPENKLSAAKRQQ